MVGFNSLRLRLETVDRREPQSRKEALGAVSSLSPEAQSTRTPPRACLRLLVERGNCAIFQAKCVVVQAMGRGVWLMHAMCEQKVQSAQMGAQRTPRIFLGEPIQDSAVDQISIRI